MESARRRRVKMLAHCSSFRWQWPQIGTRCRVGNSTNTVCHVSWTSDHAIAAGQEMVHSSDEVRQLTGNHSHELTRAWCHEVVYELGSHCVLFELQQLQLWCVWSACQWWTSVIQTQIWCHLINESGDITRRFEFILAVSGGVILLVHAPSPCHARWSLAQ